MSRRKRKWHKGYLFLTLAAGVFCSWFFLTRVYPAQQKMVAKKGQTGYKVEDRLKLEKLIHEGTKND